MIYWFVPVSLFLHIGASLWHVLQRKTYKRMGALSWFQWVLGFIIPLFLFGHITATRYVEMSTIQDEFSYLVYIHIIANDPMTMSIMLTLMVTFIWVHSCNGMHRWLSLKSGYKKNIHYWFSAALMVPISSFAGIMSTYNEYKLRWADNINC